MKTALLKQLREEANEVMRVTEYPDGLINIRTKKSSSIRLWVDTTHNNFTDDMENIQREYILDKVWSLRLLRNGINE